MFNQHGNPFNLFNPPPGDPYASFSSRLHTYDHNGNSDSGITVTVEDDHSMHWFPNGTPENVMLLRLPGN
jgi:hypothetical protein